MNNIMMNCIKNCPKCKNMISIIPDVYGESYYLECKYKKDIVQKDTFCNGMFEPKVMVE